MQIKRPESVLVVIYDNDNRVLALQRMDDPEFWQSVTGTLETEERPYETANREVFEETGIDIVAHEYELINTGQVNQYEIRQQWRYRYPKNCTTNTEYVFLLQVDRDIPIQLTEHTAFQWISPQQAISTMWSETNRRAIQQHLKLI